MTSWKCTRVGFSGIQTGGLRMYSPGSFTDIPITHKIGKRQKVRTISNTAYLATVRAHCQRLRLLADRASTGQDVSVAALPLEAVLALEAVMCLHYAGSAQHRAWQ